MALTDEDLASIAQLVTKQFDEVNANIDTKLNSAITKRLSDADKKFQKELEAFKASNVVKPEAAPGTEAPKEDVRLKTLEAMVREQAAKTEDAERRARAATEKNREAAKRARVAELLGKAGVTAPALVEIGVGFLVDSAKLVTYQDDDENADRLVFRTPETNDTVELTTGFNAWLKTEHAKHILPAKGVHGSGSKQSGGNGVHREPTAEERLYSQLAEGLRKNLG